jgi:hypothetical protein
MKKRNAAVWIWICALLLALTAGLAMAQSDSAEESAEDQSASAPSAETTESAETVYTTDYLKKRFEKTEASPAVYTNESLDDEPAEPAPQAAGAYTNEDLKERFGAEGEAEAAEPDEGEAGEADDEPAEPAEAEAAAEPSEPSEPSMSAEERAERIAEIDGELQRLEKRLLAIRNPLLAGTAPPTAEEQAAGEDNLERLRRTEEKIDELKAALEQLRAEDN